MRYNLQLTWAVSVLLKYTNVPAKSVVVPPFSALEQVKFYKQTISLHQTRFVSNLVGNPTLMRYSLQHTWAVSVRIKYTNAPAKSVVFTPFSALEPVKLYVEPIYALVTKVWTCYPVHMQKTPTESAFFLSYDVPNRYRIVLYPYRFCLPRHTCSSPVNILNIPYISRKTLWIFK